MAIDAGSDSPFPVAGGTPEVTQIPHMGSRLKKLRKNVGLTQTELASRLGLTRARVTQWEASQFYNTDLERLLKLQMALKLRSVEDLLGDSASAIIASRLNGSAENADEAS